MIALHPCLGWCLVFRLPSVHSGPRGWLMLQVEAGEA